MSATPRGAGDRDKLVIIQTVAPVEGGGQFPTGTLVDLAREWMARDEVPGSESFMADQTSARYDTVWTMPYRAEMDPDVVDVPKTKRLVYKGRAYDIVGATNINGDAEIAIRTLAGSRVD